MVPIPLVGRLLTRFQIPLSVYHTFGSRSLCLSPTHYVRDPLVGFPLIWFQIPLSVSLSHGSRSPCRSPTHMVSDPFVGLSLSYGSRSFCRSPLAQHTEAKKNILTPISHFSKCYFRNNILPLKGLILQQPN